MIACRTGSPDPCRVEYALVTGSRSEKLSQLGAIRGRADLVWKPVPRPLEALIPGDDAWEMNPVLHDIFPTFGVGVTAGRTWIIAPERATLERRWQRLIDERDPEEKRRMLKEHENDRLITSEMSPLPGFHQPQISLAVETNRTPSVMRFGYRSFDRQWVIADKRVINRPNADTLWENFSDLQVYAVANKRHAVVSGPAVTYSAYPPDNGYHRAAGGEYVLPLYLDRDGQFANIQTGLEAALSECYGYAVSGEDIFAYTAGVAAHSAYTRVYLNELSRPGVRIPFTTNGVLFDEVQRIGRRVVWLQTFGERFVDTANGRPRGISGLTTPVVTRGLRAGEFPDYMSWSEDEQLHLGSARFSPVSRGVWEYDVSGMNVLERWFKYRQAVAGRRGRGERSPLDSDLEQTWNHSRTIELLEILRVLTALRGLESRQANLLDRVRASRCFSRAEFRAAGVQITDPAGESDERETPEDMLF